MNTMDYYKGHAKEFFDNTVGVSVKEIQEKFLSYMPNSGVILDFGCGSGRDAKVFIQRGFQVEAIDGSPELCKMASEYIGQGVREMKFQELVDVGKYDGIWACASILHLNRDLLLQILIKMSVALKPQGIIYTSFKYGDFEGERKGRYFLDLNEERLHQLLEEVNNLSLEELWITSDARPGREEEQWMNMILRKVDRT